MKAIVAAALALFLGSCTCLMPLASAADAAQDHSCCQKAPKAEKSSDCCMRAAIPATASFVAPPFVALGVAASSYSTAPAMMGPVLRPNTLSPPDDPVSACRSSRAPPTILD